MQRRPRAITAAASTKFIFGGWLTTSASWEELVEDVDKPTSQIKKPVFLGHRNACLIDCWFVRLPPFEGRPDARNEF
eukprot:4259448-Prymnesium_polylepis.1